MIGRKKGGEEPPFLWNVVVNQATCTGIALLLWLTVLSGFM